MIRISTYPIIVVITETEKPNNSMYLSYKLDKNKTRKKPKK